MVDGEGQKPLDGVVICGTSLGQDIRSTIGPLGVELGATHKLDLTSDVTHLLCASVASEKYRHVARHRPDIHVLQPEWLFAIRDAWIQGGDVDVTGITRRYRLPTFEGLNICVTGFNDVKQRQWLQTTTSNNGAKYHGDLTKEVSHLVAAKPEGAKYERAKVWGIKVVSLKWFERSVERGMILDESCFDPFIPVEQQGKGSFEPRARKSESGKRLKAEGDDTQNSRRKMRRTASTRLNSQSQTLWADLSMNEDSIPPPLDDSWTQSVDPGKDLQQTVETQPIEESDNRSRPSLPRNESSEKLNRGLFSGWICKAHGYDATKGTIAKLKHYLSENGAEIADSTEEFDQSDVPYKALILPAGWAADQRKSIPTVSRDVKLLTEWWVERCIVHKKALDPDKDVLSNAFIDLPKDFFKDMVISTSGMGHDVRYIAALVKAAGGEYLEALDRRTTVLIHNISKDDLEKPVYCAERNIDVVRPQWFFESLRTREVQPVYPHYLPSSVWDAVNAIREGRRRGKSDGELAQSKKTEGELEHVRGTRKPQVPRLSGFKRQSRTPALALARPAPPPALKMQSSRRPTPLGEISQNSQERSKSQHTPDVVEDEPPAMLATEPAILDNVQDKENSPEIQQLDGQVDEMDRRSRGSPARSVSKSMPPEASEFVSNFLARRQNSGSVAQDKATGKGKRKLGRAASGSTTTSFVKPTASPFIEDESFMPSIQEPPMPSQQITYEAPGAAEHRRIMSRRMGTNFDEEGGKRVQNLGVVRDADSTKAVGQRVRGRHRDVR
ncbi:hypothetical protein KVT40_001251 [Elsinoe batatas]|uniref:BRCT domain-containing protein n=1 Tax=Elsinoe batatas TaxID=2601811 RepID=A0A8K0L8V9_9PEZI|nr:hypothetical protein KVT40_001251 [Elsinoe batatas]